MKTAIIRNDEAKINELEEEFAFLSASTREGHRENVRIIRSELEDNAFS